MTKQELFEAIGLTKQTFLSESEDYHAVKHHRWVKWAALAACAVLVIGIGGFAGLFGGAKSSAPESAADMSAAVAGDSGTDSSAATDAPREEYKSEGTDAEAPMAAPREEAETEETIDTPCESMNEFTSYAGPILPLTLAAGSETVTATRELTLDFLPFEMDKHQALLTDRYVLTNTSDKDVKLTTLWPFVSDLRDVGSARITLSIDGRQTDTTLFAGDYVGGFSPVQFDEAHENERGNLKYPQKWMEFAALLKDGSYQDAALRDTAPLEQGVTVYWFRDTTAPSDAQAATVAATFALDQTQSQIFTYGINGYGYDSNSGDVTYSYFARTYIESERDALHALIVLGEDIGEITLGGYENGACEAGGELDGVSATLVREEMQLGELIELLCTDYLKKHDSLIYGENGSADPQAMALLSDCAAKLLRTYGPLADEPVERYREGRLDDIISEAYSMERVCYAAVDLTIPAGESVTVELRAKKDASFNFYMGDDTDTDIHGFELLTDVGTELALTQQTVKLLLGDAVTVSDTNFDLMTDVMPLTSTLTASYEEYYIEVRQTETE